MAVTINASTSAGLVNTADTSGVLALQSNGTTALTTSGANVTIAGTLTTAAQSIAKASLPTGSVLQVVSATLTTGFSTSSTSMVDVTGLSLSITPTSASSKVLITVNMSASAGAGGAVLFYQMVRDSTAIGIGTTGGANFNVTGGMYSGDASTNQNFIYPGSQLLDSPATTSATTYKVQISSNNGAQAVYVNKRSDNYISAISTITAMEIAA